MSQQLTAHDEGEPWFYRIDSRPSWAVVCQCPKAGSTMWNAAFLRGLVLQGFQLNGTEYRGGQVFFENVHGNLQWLPYANPDVPFSSVPRLMFVRHPVPRLLSAYLNKITNGRLDVPGSAC
eukprot:6487590-Prymnesium_polylepis.1